MLSAFHQMLQPRHAALKAPLTKLVMRSEAKQQLSMNLLTMRAVRPMNGSGFQLQDYCLSNQVAPKQRKKTAK